MFGRYGSEVVTQIKASLFLFQIFFFLHFARYALYSQLILHLKRNVEINLIFFVVVVVIDDSFFGINIII